MVANRLWLVSVLLCGCFSPLRCDESMPRDAGVERVYDLAGVDVATPGSACASVDECNRINADNCDGHCRCGNGNPCVSGACCDGRCVDVTQDPENCGACGIACPSGQCASIGNSGPHCTCDADAGSGCSSPLEPTCNAQGLCSCGGATEGVCGPPAASSCGDHGCGCSNGPACGGPYSDHCDPAQGCRCGAADACDPKLATSCDPSAADSPCRCANGPGCTAGTFCCTQDSSCCSPSQYCCLDGCCDQPCLLFGFCH